MPFKGQFKKCIQVENEEELQVTFDERESWEIALKEDFEMKVRR